MSRIAGCSNCGEPVVGTLAFRYAELYCVNCGRRYGMFGNLVVLADTPEVNARLSANEAEWKELSHGLLSDGGMYLDPDRPNFCSECKAKHEPHTAHASPEELAAHEAALVRIRERAAQPA